MHEFLSTFFKNKTLQEVKTFYASTNIAQWKELITQACKHKMHNPANMFEIEGTMMVYTYTYMNIAPSDSLKVLEMLVKEGTLVNAEDSLLKKIAGYAGIRINTGTLYLHKTLLEQEARSLACKGIPVFHLSQLDSAFPRFTSQELSTLVSFGHKNGLFTVFTVDNHKYVYLHRGRVPQDIKNLGVLKYRLYEVEKSIEKHKTELENMKRCMAEMYENGESRMMEYCCDRYYAVVRVIERMGVLRNSMRRIVAEIEGYGLGGLMKSLVELTGAVKHIEIVDEDCMDLSINEELEYVLNKRERSFEDRKYIKEKVKEVIGIEMLGRNNNALCDNEKELENIV